jgi:LysR family transcriptional regulator, cyn operon transcriptional activator
MKLIQLRTFVMIADNGGFARAAARLHLTQSAASRQISALESELNVLLFDRVGRRIRLTSEGEDLLQRSRRLLADADLIGERARSLKGGQVGTLRVSATSQVIENLLAPFLSQYLQRHPGVEVRLSESGGAGQHRQLERGEVQLAIMAAGGERMQSRLLYPIHVMAVFPAAHRFARRTTLNIAELADEPLLLLNGDFGSRSWFDAACDVAGIRAPVLLESGAPQTLMALAAIGYGIAILPSNVQRLQSAVRAVPLVYRGASVGRWSVVAWNANRFLAPYAEQFIKELVASVRRGYPGRDLTRGAPALPRPK